MTTTPCAHCRLPVRGSGLEPLFCCVGCRIAWSATAGSSDGERRFLEARLLLSAFLAMGVMTFSLVLHGDSLYGIPDDAGRTLVRTLGGMLLAGFSLPVLLLLGLPLVRGAWTDLRRGVVRMDGLIVMATFAAFGLSLSNTLQGLGTVYYETATLVLVLVSLGRRLEARARLQGADAMETLRSLLPHVAHRVRDGETEDVDPMALGADDVIHVRPGEAFPADARVLQGRSTFQCAHLTGEEEARPVEPGLLVPAGAVNGVGLVLATVTAPADSGSLQRIRELLDAPLPLTRRLRMIDRLAGVLAAIAIVLAVVGGLRSATAGTAGDGIRTALSVLLVACPCALGLATPLAYRAMRAALARNGVLVHEPVALEVAASLDRAVLDKTGTLTDAQRLRWRSLAGSDAHLGILQNVVAWSGHAMGRGTPLGQPPADLEVHPGQGVSAVVNGQRLRIGSPQWLDHLGVPWDAPAARARLNVREHGSLVAMEMHGTVCALAQAQHVLNPGAERALRNLERLGVIPWVASGDRAGTVFALAEELGVDAEGELLPDQKVARVESLRRAGHRVLFVGDGVNDAPALRAADVSAVVADSTAVARHQAQMTLVSADLRGIPATIEAARKLRSTVRGNLGWTLAYNAIALVAATLGALHPLLAAGAMIVSSLIVAVRSYRLLDYVPPSLTPCEGAVEPQAAASGQWCGVSS